MRTDDLRVVIVNKHARVTGGADQHVIGLAAALREQGHQVRVLATASPDNVEREGRFVPLFVTNATRESLAARQRAAVAARAVWNGTAARQMGRLLDEFRPDVVHVHKLYPQLSVAPVVVAARRRVPVVQTLHDLEVVAANPLAAAGQWRDQVEARADFRALNTATYALRRFVQRPRVSAFVAPSRFVADIHRRFGIPAVVIPNFTEFAGRGSPRGFDDRDGIVFVGQLMRHKGVADAVEVARRLPGHRVTLAGFGPLEAFVRDAVGQLPNATYVGAADRGRLEELLGSARALLMPSAYPEIGPLIAIEAMAFGTPVVGYAHSGLAEYVDGAGGGRTVAGSAEALAAAAAEVHDDRNAWTRLSASAAGAVAERHSPAAYAAEIAKVYASCDGRAG